MYDVLVIGGGVVGCSVVRELSRFKLKTALVEKGADVAWGSSRANSGIVLGGYDAKPDTLKAHYNVAGNALFDRLSEDLDLPFTRNGKPL